MENHFPPPPPKKKKKIGEQTWSCPHSAPVAGQEEGEDNVVANQEDNLRKGRRIALSARGSPTLTASDSTFLMQSSAT